MKKHLTPAQVRGIYRSTKIQREIATQFGVSQMVVSNIRTRKTYNSITHSSPDIIRGKLTEEQIREVYYSTKTPLEIAIQFGVSRSLVSKIRTRKTHKRVTRSFPSIIRGKLTEEQVLEVYYSTKTPLDIATQLGVSRSLVYSIQAGKTHTRITHSFPDVTQGKLTNEQVCEVYYSTKTQSEIALQFGISSSMVSTIQTRKTHNNVTHSFPDVARGGKGGGRRAGVKNLTIEQVHEIYHSVKFAADIATQFGISISTVSDVRTRKTYTRITRSFPDVARGKLTEQVCEIYYSTKTPLEIATQFGISISTVYSIRARETYTHITCLFPDITRGRLTDEQVREIYYSTKTKLEVAAEFGVCRSTVINIQMRKTRNHITNSFPDVAHTTGGGKSKLTDEQVLQIRASKDTQTEIAKKYGISQPHVSLIRHGLAHKHVGREV